MRPQQSARAELIAPEKAGQGQPEAGLIRRGFLEEADVVEGTQAPGREGPREQPCGSWGGPGGVSQGVRVLPGRGGARHLIWVGPLGRLLLLLLAVGIAVSSTGCPQGRGLASLPLVPF